MAAELYPVRRDVEGRKAEALVFCNPHRYDMALHPMDDRKSHMVLKGIIYLQQKAPFHGKRRLLLSVSIHFPKS